LSTAAGSPPDPDYGERVRASFAAQRIMATLGARLIEVAPGVAAIELDYREDLTQQDGFLHAGVVATVLDSACGYAAYSLMPAGVGVLTVEYKINLLAPAVGLSLVARAEVARAGRTLSVVRGLAIARGERGDKTVAIMQATVMATR
jgi:uncharacterized protein (TIGR00369 family)